MNIDSSKYKYISIGQGARQRKEQSVVCVMAVDDAHEEGAQSSSLTSISLSLSSMIWTHLGEGAAGVTPLGERGHLLLMLRSAQSQKSLTLLMTWR